MRQIAALAVAVLTVAMTTPLGRAQTVVTGTVVDSSSGEPVPRATVRAAGTYAGTAADEAGRFSFRMPAGRRTLRVGAVGYATAIRSLPVRRDSAEVTVRLRARSVPLGHVTVEADRTTSETRPSTFTIRPASVKQAPGLGEPDVIRAAASLPGISRPNDIDARLNVRGGSSDQNQYLLDGVEIYNPTHLFGLFGAFNPYVTGNTTVHAASFPARHGGRLSSVIDVRTRTPPDSGYTRANLSLASLSGAHAQQWGDTGVVVGVRRTYLDPILAATGGPEGGSMGYNFLDTNVKATHALSDQVSIAGFGFLQRDDLSVEGEEGPFDDEETTGAASENTETTWGNALGALRLRVRHGTLRHELTGSVVRSFTNVELSTLSLDNTLRDWTLRYDGTLTENRTRLRVGGYWKRRVFDYGWDSSSREPLGSVLYGGLGVEDPPAGLPTTWQTRTTQTRFAGHATVERRLLDERLTLNGGLRLDALRSGAAVWQPRLRATVQATSALRLHASAGRYAQYVATGYEGQEFNVAEPLLPLDRPTTAWTYTTGLTADLGDAYRVRAVAYARTMDRFPRLREEAPSGDGLPFRYGTATAYGLDLLAERSRGWITGQFGYSFGRVRTEFDGKRSPPSWAIPHSLRATLGLKLGTWTIQTSGHVRSGLPYTPAVGRIKGIDQPTGGLQDRYLLGEKNSERVPPYARVDLALRRTYTADRFDWTLYVQALNVLNRRNVLRIIPGEFYAFGIDDTGGGQQQGAQRSLPIVPTVGVEFSF